MKNFWEQIKKPILALAPMAGVTDAAFRRMCKLLGADVIYTEFASADALAYNAQKTLEILSFKKEERPIVAQIFGKNPDMMYQATKKVQELGFDGVDINFGCPAYKVVRHGGGVTLMRDLPRVCELVAAVTEAANQIPVSIKIRGSIKSDDKKDTIYAIDLVRAIEDLPVKALMVHGRSFEKPFDGFPNTETITEVVRTFPGVVLANGGVFTPEDAKRLLDETGAAGIGIARGAWGQPWIFNQIKEFLATGKYHELTMDEKITHIIQHAELALDAKGGHGIIELRKHLTRYIKGIPGASALRAQLVQVTDAPQLKAILKQIR